MLHGQQPTHPWRCSWRMACANGNGIHKVTFWHRHLVLAPPVCAGCHPGPSPGGGGGGGARGTRGGHNRQDDHRWVALAHKTDCAVDIGHAGGIAVTVETGGRACRACVQGARLAVPSISPAAASVPYPAMPLLHGVLRFAWMAKPRGREIARPHATRTAGRPTATP